MHCNSLDAENVKLTDLNPHWFVLEDGGPVVGLTFDCPHCQKTRLAVAFHHHARAALEDQYILAHSPSTQHIWDTPLPGETFETLTLRPSIDASRTGHWHGFITDGEAK